MIPERDEPLFEAIFDIKAVCDDLSPRDKMKLGLNIIAGALPEEATADPYDLYDQLAEIIKTETGIDAA